MSMRLLVRSIALAIAAVSAPAAQAAAIHHEATRLSADRWRHDYTVSVSPGDVAPAQMTLWFERGLYADLSLPSSPAGWDGLVVQPDAALPADGFVDVLAPGGTPVADATITGWSVAFTWLGAGTPGAQAFEFIDPATFRPLLSGFTTAVDGPVDGSVPEPSTLLLVGGLAWALRARRPGRAARATEVRHD